MFATLPVITIDPVSMAQIIVGLLVVGSITGFYFGLQYAVRKCVCASCEAEGQS